MKKIIVFFAIVCIIYSCSPVEYKVWNKSLHTEQAKSQKYYAARLTKTRDLLSRSLSSYLTSDTLFLIERTGEVSQDLEGAAWNEKRDLVFLFSERQFSSPNGVSFKFDSVTIRYSEWQDPLKMTTEKFDISKVKQQKVLGGYRTFITQVIKKTEVKTTFFDDFSDPYLPEDKK